MIVHAILAAKLSKLSLWYNFDKAWNENHCECMNIEIHGPTFGILEKNQISSSNFIEYIVSPFDISNTD